MVPTTCSSRHRDPQSCNPKDPKTGSNPYFSCHFPPSLIASDLGLMIVAALVEDKVEEAREALFILQSSLCSHLKDLKPTLDMTSWDLTANLAQYPIPTQTQMRNVACLNNLCSSAHFIADLEEISKVDKKRQGFPRPRTLLSGIFYSPPNADTRTFEKRCQIQFKCSDIIEFKKVKNHALKLPRIFSYNSVSHIHLCSLFSIWFCVNFVASSLVVCIIASSTTHQLFFTNSQCSTYSDILFSFPDNTST